MSISGVKTSNEAAAAALTGAELVRGVQSGGNVKITATQVRDFVLKFPATQVPSADANTLDDYEEGTFTPTVGDGTNNYTLSTAIGHYTKIGRVVTAYFFAAWSSIGSAGAPQTQIGGFPFPAAMRNGGVAWETISGVDFATGLQITASFTAASATFLRVSRERDSAGSESVPANSANATGAYAGVVTYFTS